MTYATIKVDLAKASEIKDFIHATEINDENHPYDFFDGSYENVHVHAYKNKKEIFTITFTGEGNRPAELASFFAENVTVKEHANTLVKKADKAFECWEDFGPQIGSDEVGKGDFFGPLIVVACYVDKKDIEYLEKLKINDSKKMKDDYILEIGPSIKRRIKNYVVAVSANKLSVMNENNFNIDKILSLCHNHAQRGLIEKYGSKDEYNKSQSKISLENIKNLRIEGNIFIYNNFKFPNLEYYYLNIENIENIIFEGNDDYDLINIFLMKNKFILKDLINIPNKLKNIKYLNINIKKYSFIYDKIKNYFEFKLYDEYLNCDLLIDEKEISK